MVVFIVAKITVASARFTTASQQAVVRKSRNVLSRMEVTYLAKTKPSNKLLQILGITVSIALIQ